MWGALLVAPLIFGLAAVFNYAGMANTLACRVRRSGPALPVLAPVLGWIAVALSGSATSSNTLFGAFQLSVGRLLGVPDVLFPALNSVGRRVRQADRPADRQRRGLHHGAGPPRRQHHPLQPGRGRWPMLGYVMLVAALFALFVPQVARL